MPYATNRDRNPTTLEYTRTPWPLPPLNLFLTSGWRPGVYDLRWDDPSVLALNSAWSLLGVNVYRSFDSEFGPYHRITQVPVGSNFWRDQTDVEVVEEVIDAAQWTNFGVRATGDGPPLYSFRTRLSPIVQSGSQAVPTMNPQDVVVLVGDRPARILAVSGQTGEVWLDPSRYTNVAQQNYDDVVLPASPQDRVVVVYRRVRSFLPTDLAQRVFYRVCAVGSPADCQMTAQTLVETPLENAVATSNQEIEKLDYIWREAVRRNRWILEQGGERVRLFLRKNAGVPCVCVPTTHHKQPQSDCLRCYGSGFLGGFEGPYETIVAPDDAEKRISQKDIGRTLEHTYEVWTGPVPLLSMRDFLVKINGERYSIGAVRMPTNRGMVLQQHFNIGHLDEKDIRYKVPMDRPLNSLVQFGPTPPEQGGPTPITEKPNIPDERELRGRTKVWENITY